MSSLLRKLEEMTPLEIYEHFSECSISTDICPDSESDNELERFVAGVFYANDRLSECGDENYDVWKDNVLSIVRG